MDDLIIRVVLVAGVAGLALGVGRVVGRWQQPIHPAVDIEGLGLPPGIIAFTSTDCDNCRRVMSMLRTLDVPVREVTHELEAGLFDSAAVEAVPLVVVTDQTGRPVRQFAGNSSKRAVRRAARASGW